MIDEVVRAANELGMSQDEIHYEAFQINTSGDPFTVELRHSKKTMEVDADKTLLETLREAGLEVESSCETGNCGTCRVDVCEGKVVCIFSLALSRSLSYSMDALSYGDAFWKHSAVVLSINFGFHGVYRFRVKLIQLTGA